MNESRFLLFATLLLAGGAGAQSRESLVDPASYHALAADHRAYRVGDVLTVYVLEATRARSQAATDASSAVNAGASVHSPNTRYDATLGLNASDSGGAQTTRVGELRTQVSAQVIAVDPNGALHIDGVQTLTINGERQTIRLTGMVRPEDVAADNTVLSTRIAHAELELVGAGVVSASQRQSIVYRALKWLGLL
jgi:flagellar L-ring protein precursor FlgH